jgi:cation transport protein ChaC
VGNERGACGPCFETLTAFAPQHEVVRMMLQKPLWIFAYGSLMWNPGFAVRETQPARLHGFHRAFCIYSEHYRGTPQKPGLILGLLAGGSCRGLAHRLPSGSYDKVRRYLWRREIENDGVYVEEVRTLHLADGRSVPSLVYLADKAHRQFAGKLSLTKSIKLVRQGRGATGSNVDYVRNTVAHLRELGLRDRTLEELARRAG